MLVVETIAKIRRAHFIEGKPIKQICRELRVSRNTVRKVIRSGATEFTYDRATSLMIVRRSPAQRSTLGGPSWTQCWPRMPGGRSGNA